MGALFELEHINFVGYITAEKPLVAPRCDEATLWAFLVSFGSPQEVARHTVSNDKKWQSGLVGAAGKSLSSLNSGSNRILSEREVAMHLDPLRTFFTGYAVDCLVIPPPADQDFPYADRRDSSGATDAFQHFVAHSALDILVLMPHTTGPFVNVIDPFPPLRALVANPAQLPCGVFWMPSGEAVAMPLPDAREFFERHIAKGENSDKYRHHLRSVIAGEAKRRAAKRILHISDLHFGDDAANRRKAYLKEHLRNVVSKVDRVVVSGDLFDEPDEKFRGIFDEFDADLKGLTPKTPILIPGNHDVRKSGNAVFGFGRSADQFIGVRFEPLIIDDDLRTVFFCFNSCEGGNFATGYVSEKQRVDLGTAFERLLHERPHVAHYSRISVVHHHPYTYESAPTVFYEKIMSMFSSREDRFVAFENSDQFLNWCGSREISLILHGHKHVPHVIMADINVREQQRKILIVGCGSSTGVENKPMCYDIVSLDPVTKRWNVVFYSDPGDGSGFAPQNVTLDLRTAVT
jgi:Calcineurin-like phosphoesterase